MQFKQVVGQEEIKQHLVQIAKEERVPHAQLFLSHPGTGGLTLALAFAQYLVCENPTETDSCGLCPACIRAEKMIHPDIHFTYPVIRKASANRPPISSDFAEEWRKEIDKNSYITEYEWLQAIQSENKQGNITREEANQIIEKLNLQSFEGGYKIQIIWMAENLAEVGNALLKLIEEPAGKTVILLIAENQEAILPTIISRTQIIKIPKIKESEIAAHLHQNFNVNQEKSKQIAYISDGNYRKAQLLALGELDEFGEELKNWFVYCLNGPAPDLMKWTEDTHGKGREYIKKFFDYAINMFREALVYKYSKKQIQPHVSESEFPTVRALNKYISYKSLEEIIDRFEESAYHIERNSNAKITLLSLSIRLNKILRAS
ncbi:MAG: hypothetical protein M9887_07090 [Chitinophagales bacterium]|nr:hypothetical protein [Chitinophagales bacterium]